ncbi:hypothetical protein IAG41_16100 [Sphingomonas sp. JC676]|uniref:hypothetical protein n=1 Tax=Sphingomonas sp. JC676 TaxID=2768065 RepID=UPI0016577118|nr:hypothetical protein [Sphingomonas sp. JC676]MBC9033915.1 hypothetical protein [Sphingomonas sp. JC676]
MFLPLALLSAELFGTALSDAELANQRGGIHLPNGIDVAITVQTETAIDNAVVLRSVFKIDQGQPKFTIFVPRPGERVTSESRGADGRTPLPSVSYDSRTGIQVVPGYGAPAVSTADAASMQIREGLMPVDPTGPVQTDFGTVFRKDQGGVAQAALQGSDFSVTHFAGAAFGSLITNSGNDRVIDTTTTLAIDLRNAGPDLVGSAMPRVENIAIDALQSRVR